MNNNTLHKCVPFPDSWNVISNDLPKENNSQPLKATSSSYEPTNRDNSTKKTTFVWQRYYTSPVLLSPPPYSLKRYFLEQND